jgi:RHS repeat-associated protein
MLKPFWSWTNVFSSLGLKRVKKTCGDCKRHRAQRSLRFESLEVRQLLSGAPYEDLADQQIALLSAREVTTLQPVAQLELASVVIDAPALPVVTLPEVTVHGAASPEGDPLTFIVDLSTPSTEEITLQYATESEVAGEDDFHPAIGTITFKPGETRATVTVDTKNDSLSEGDEHFWFKLSGDKVRLANPVATGVILDNDAKPSIDVLDTVVNAGETATFFLYLSNPSERQVAVRYVLQNGSASWGRDFQRAHGTVIFEPGQVTARIEVPVPLVAAGRQPKDFRLRLLSPVNATLDRDVATATIKPAVAHTSESNTLLRALGEPMISVGGGEAVEGQPITFSIYVTNIDSDVSLCYWTADGTTSSSEDYSPTYGYVTLGPNDPPHQVVIATHDEGRYEPNEHFYLTASIYGGTASDTSVGTIIEPSLEFWVDSPDRVYEGEDQTFWINISRTYAHPIDLSIDTEDSSAFAGYDYQGLTQHAAQIPAGSTRTSVVVATYRDGYIESDESYNLNVSVSLPSYSPVSVASGGGYILDDPVVVTLEDASCGESDGSMSFKLKVKNRSSLSEDITVFYGTSNGSATAEDDYTEKSFGMHSVVIGSGSSEETISVEVNDDLLCEGDETFNLTISIATSSYSSSYGVSGAICDRDYAIGTIVDDDPPPPPPSGCTDECCPTGGGAGNNAPGPLGGPNESTTNPSTGGVDFGYDPSSGTGGCATGNCNVAGQTLTYSSHLATHTFGQGYGWTSSQSPYASYVSSESIAIVFNPQLTIRFELVNQEYVAQHGAKHKLTLSGDVYKVVAPDGTVTQFYNHTQTAGPKGAFKQSQTPSGKTTTASYDYYGSLQSLTETVGGQPVRQLSYTYEKDRVSTFTLSVGGVGQRLVEYEYYGDNEDYGSPGDLKRVSSFDRESDDWEAGDVVYYRYYKSGEANGFKHALKRVLLPEAYQKAAAKAAETDRTVDELSEEEIASFTCYAYKYDANGRAKEEIVYGGSGTYGYEFTTNSSPQYQAGDNTWERRNVQTRSDGTTLTTYYNAAGQQLLSDLHETGTANHWITLKTYENGQVKRAYDATAVSSYAEQSNGVINVTFVAQGSYKYDEYSYYNGTDGAPLGYKKADHIVHVQDGAIVESLKLRDYQYSSNTAGGVTVYKISEVHQFKSASPTDYIATSYAYTYHTGTNQIKEVVTTLPVVSTTHNGSGVAAVRRDFYDSIGRLRWSMDERGRVSYYEYNLATGAMTRVARDVDSNPATALNPTVAYPTNWAALPANGCHEVTDYEIDSLGRTIRVLGPEFQDNQGNWVRTVSWTGYLDTNNQTRRAQGYVILTGQGGSESSSVVEGPVSISESDYDGRPTQAIEATTTGQWFTTLADFLDGTVSPAQSDYCGWAVNQYSKTRLATTAVYFAIPEGTADPDEDKFAGEEGVHYNVTAYEYDGLGRMNKVTSPGGTITYTVFDRCGQVWKTYVGTNATEATETDPTNGGLDGNNMKLASENVYDNGQPGGNGLLTESRTYDSDTTYLSTHYGYTWRNQHEWTLVNDGTYQTYTKNVYDFLGRVTQVDQYRDVGLDGVDPVGDPTPNDRLIGRQTSAYDDRGRVYYSDQYSVSQDGTYASPYIYQNTWYDPAGNVFKQSSNSTPLLTKTLYDGLGRVLKQYTSYDSSETYTDLFDAQGQAMLNMADDRVYTQVEYTYDTAGNVALVNSRERYAYVLQQGPYGELQGPTTTYAKSRDQYTAYWYDGLGRPTHTANYGTNGDQALAARPASPPSTDPETVLVSETRYDDAGQAYERVDANGRVDRTEYDDAGRVVATIQNYTDDGVAKWHLPDQNVTILTTYTPDGQVATYTAVNPLRGDFNFDGVVDVNDIDLLQAAMRAPGTDALYDLNSDTTADYFDLVVLVETIIGTRVGDVDLDGTVDIGDLVVLSGHLDQPGTWTWADGDFSGDQKVTFYDYQLLAPNYSFSGTLNVLSPHQTTTYVYGWLAGDTGLRRMDTLAGVIYPDSDDVASVDGGLVTFDDGDDDAYDRVEYTYDRVGRQATFKDQNETVHSYVYDGVGRLLHDRITDYDETLIDYSVLRLSRTYNDRGLLEHFTSYNNPNPGQGTAVNDVYYVYTTFNRLAREYQNHLGFVTDLVNTPYLEYGYTSGANTGKLSYVFYPNQTRVGFTYLASGHLASVTLGTGGGTGLANYQYLGTNTLLNATYRDPISAQNVARYTLGTTSAITGLDRFNRVTNHLWQDTAATPNTLDQYLYGYDAAGNRVWKENVKAAAYNYDFDELYQYDDMYQLIATKRGDLVDGLDGKEIVDEVFGQGWDLDSLGNWVGFDDDGTPQAREHNAANEITSLDGSASGIAHDAAGNMIRMPMPGNGATALDVKYDAWNRMKTVSASSVLLGRYDYDASGRRIIKYVPGDGQSTPDKYEHFYHNGQQVVETRERSDAQAPGLSDVKHQFVWSPHYIDRLILRDTFSGGQRQNAERLFYLADANYNVTGVMKRVDGAWTVAERYLYDAYGNVQVRDGNFDVDTDGLSDVGNTTLFTGRELDIESGLMYYRARYYHTDLGRFTARDPLGRFAGSSLYHYVHNNPLTRIDPSGLYTCFRDSGKAPHGAWVFVDYGASKADGATYVQSLICRWKRTACMRYVCDPRPTKPCYTVVKENVQVFDKRIQVNGQYWTTGTEYLPLDASLPPQVEPTWHVYGPDHEKARLWCESQPPVAGGNADTDAIALFPISYVK